MKKTLILVSLILLVLTGCSKNRFKRSEFLQDLYDQKIWPDLLETETRLHAFSASWDAYANNPGEQLLVNTRDDFEACLSAFERIAFYNLGDISAISVYNAAYKTSVDTVSLWQKYEQAEFFTETTVQGYTTKEKGIFTLEYLLFSVPVSDSINSARYRSFMNAQLEALESNFSAIKTSWSTYEKNFVAADDEGVEGSYNIIINRIVHQLEDIIEKRINAPLNAQDVSLAVGYRSETAWQNIQAMVSQLNLIYLGKGTEDFNSVYTSVHRKNKKLADKIKNAFVELENLGDAMTASYDYYVDTGSSELTAYKEKLKEVLVYFKLDVVNELDIVLTFGDNDGD